MTRDEIIEDEFIRAKPRGIRYFTPGMLKLCRKLEVQSTLLPSMPRKRDASRDQLIIAWLMDERHSDQEIRELADKGRDEADPIFDAYEFSVSVVFVAACTAEMERTQRALAAVQFKIEPKPGGGGPDPAGK